MIFLVLCLLYAVYLMATGLCENSSPARYTAEVVDKNGKHWIVDGTRSYINKRASTGDFKILTIHRQ